MLWIKALHIISVICWFAGLFYLPRLYVYHADTTDSISIDRFKIMERRLYKGIMVPAAIATLVFGVWLAVLQWPILKTSGWFHAKVFLVLLLVGYHKMCRFHLRKFAEDANTKSSKYFRWFNEAPTILLVAIVVLVVVRPF